LIAGRLAVACVASNAGQHDRVLGVPCSLLLCSMLRSGLWQKLLEVFQEIWCSAEQSCDLGVHVLDGFRLSLVGLQYFQELFVDVRLGSKSVLVGC
jgi:hypothetical protein